MYIILKKNKEMEEEKWRVYKPAEKGVSNEATEETEHEGGTKEVGDSISRCSIP